jgi:hypothetical protein
MRTWLNRCQFELTASILLAIFEVVIVLKTSNVPSSFRSGRRETCNLVNRSGSNNLLRAQRTE